MTSAEANVTRRAGLPCGGRVRWLSLLLLSVILSFGFQAALVGGAGSAGDNPARERFVQAEAMGTQPARSSVCHVGTACAEVSALDGSLSAPSSLVARAARPDGMRSPRRFGGPSVATPPPRSLT